LSKMQEYANRMRQKPTAAEARFHARLLDASIEVSSQVILGRYIADFLIPSLGVVVEIDGGYHNNDAQMLKDIERDQWMTFKGLVVIRIQNEEVDSFPLSRILNAKGTSKAISWCKRAVPHSLKVEPRKIRRTKESIKARKEAGRARVYACYIPNGESDVIVGRPRDAMRKTQGVPCAFAKRFKTKEEAQKWLLDKLTVNPKTITQKKSARDIELEARIANLKQRPGILQMEYPK